MDYSLTSMKGADFPVLLLYCQYIQGYSGCFFISRPVTGTVISNWIFVRDLTLDI